MNTPAQEAARVMGRWDAEHESKRRAAIADAADRIFTEHSKLGHLIADAMHEHSVAWGQAFAAIDADDTPLVRNAIRMLVRAAVLETAKVEVE